MVTLIYREVGVRKNTEKAKERDRETQRELKCCQSTLSQQRELVKSLYICVIVTLVELVLHDAPDCS